MVLISIVKRHLLTFCLTTSVKGVARVVSSCRPMRLLWLMSVLAFLSTAAYYVYRTVDEFLQYPTSRVTTENIVSSINPILPPEVTVCNANPLSSTADDIATGNDIIVFDKFKKRFEEFAECSGCSNSEKSIISASTNRMELMNAYYQSIGSVAATRIGHKEHMMIAGCETVDLYGFNLRHDDCGTIVKIVHVTTSNDFNCYLLYINTTENVQRFFLGMSLVLYLDHFSNVSNGVSVENDVGIKVSVDSPRTTSFNNLDSIYLKPGTSSNIQVYQAKRERMPEPYGNCRKADDKFVKEFQTINQATTYTVRACTSLCVEEIILAECRCKDASMLNLLTQKGEQSDFCENITLPHATFIKYSICAESTRRRALAECGNKCTFPCSEILFSTTISAGAWPHNYAMNGFYDKYINNHPYADRFSDVVHWRLSPQTELVKKNFLRVSIHHGDYLVYRYVEKSAITFSNFLSRIGGALNLWSGITIIVIMELVDLIFKMAKDLCMCKQPRSNTSD